MRAAIDLLEENLPKGSKSLIPLVMMYEDFVEPGDLRFPIFVHRIKNEFLSLHWLRVTADITTLISIFSAAGLLSEISPGTYKMHPALTHHLRAKKSDAAAEHDLWCRVFAEQMGFLAWSLWRKPSHKRRDCYQVHSANFLNALKEAERLKLRKTYIQVAKYLAEHSFDSGDCEFAATLELNLMVRNL